jgi:hypothetical protein
MHLIKEFQFGSKCLSPAVDIEKFLRYDNPRGHLVLKVD